MCWRGIGKQKITSRWLFWITRGSVAIFRLSGSINVLPAGGSINTSKIETQFTVIGNELHRSRDEVSATETDSDRFRLRNFIDRLQCAEDLEIVAEPVQLADIPHCLDGNPKAVLF